MIPADSPSVQTIGIKKPRSLPGRIRDWLFKPADSIKRQDDRRQAQLLSILLLAIILLMTSGVFGARANSPVISIILAVTVVIELIAYAFSRTRHYRIAAAIAVIIQILQTQAVFIFPGNYNINSATTMLVWSSVNVLLCSLFFSSAVTSGMAGATLIAILLILFPLAHLEFTPLLVSPFAFYIGMSVLIIVIARHRDDLEKDRLFELTVANRELDAIRTQLEERVAERTKELRQAYDDVQAGHERLLHSEKMASLGRLTAGFAHEINTPLAASRAALTEVDHLIHEYQDSIDNPEVTPDDHREIALELFKVMKLADNSMENIAGFVHSIKAQTRDVPDEELLSFNAVPVIQEALLLVSHALRRGNCTVTFEPEMETAELHGIPGQLAQVITNLVTNAIDASAEKGGGPITLLLTQNRERIDLQISDQGSGIAPEIQPKIFDLLFTTKSVGHGTGLGLTIARDIVKDVFGGSIEVSSQMGEGTTFTLHFPHYIKKSK
jgi:signal transduction histidine kinase